MNSHASGNGTVELGSFEEEGHELFAFNGPRSSSWGSIGCEDWMGRGKLGR